MEKVISSTLYFETELFTFKELIKRTMGSINSNAKVVDITVEDFASTRIQTAFRDYESFSYDGRVSPKIGFSNFEALDWEIHERSSKWNSLHYLNPGCHNKHLIRTIVHLQINKDLISMKQLNA
ncbi:uncharacterized protein [Euphorbia lathyris]|uniref:uncharacterized protein isoform X3 n=1 Tax=Euphorbia lathyris TaxID=212925 RepID=UPI0033139B62